MHIYGITTESCTENLENQNRKCPSRLELFGIYKMTRRDSEYNLNWVFGGDALGTFTLLSSIGEGNNSLCLECMSIHLEMFGDIPSQDSSVGRAYD